MKIHSGTHRGRRLKGPPDETTSRPMPDRVKAAIFNLLRGHVEGEAVLDLFAGIGTMGLESFSRGASRVVHVERDRVVAGLLEENIASLGGSDVCRVVRADAVSEALLPRCPGPFHLIFADPPYALVREPEGFERVRSQLARLVPLLDDTGYLVWRLPHPLMFDVTPTYDHDSDRFEQEMDDASSGRIVITSLDDPAWDEVDELEREMLAHDRVPEGATLSEDGSARVNADFAIPGAEGPETHEYGDMAVHLFMRRDRAPA